MNNKIENEKNHITRKIIICISFCVLNIIDIVALSPYQKLSKCIIIILLLTVAETLIYFKSQIVEKFNIVLGIMSVLISAFLGYKIMRTLIWTNLDAGKNSEIFLAVTLSLSLLFIVYALLYLMLHVKEKVRRNVKEYAPSLILSAYMSWFMFLFLPLVTMVGNPDDYLLSFFHLLIVEAILFAICVVTFAVISVLLPEKPRHIVEAILVYITIMSYVQYMFMNSHMPPINGSTFDKAYYHNETIVNTVIWLAMIIVVAIIFYAKKCRAALKNIKTYLPTFLFMIQLVALVSAIITAPSSVYKLKNYSVDTTKQYYISSNKNILIFIFDAVDNDYVKELASEDIAAFDQMKDFTIYTNTCSVYDAANSSLPQMFSGSGFECAVADYNKFYQRLRDNDYIFNFYNYEYAEDNNIDIEKYFDNYQITDSSDIFSSYKISYKDIAVNSMRLTAYQIFPDQLKDAINVLKIDFKNVISHGDGSFAIEDNVEFYDNLNYVLDDSGKNYIVVQHLIGAHIPIESMVGTRQSVDIINKTIDQLKEYGLYDEATIIFTSDHGFQDDTKPGMYPMASTPAFIIKNPGDSHDSIQFNSAPIYHTDILPTILVCASLFEENDEQYFGTPIYNWHEGDKRERIWANTGGPNKYCVYTYTGTTEDLVNAVNNNEGVEYN